MTIAPAGLAIYGLILVCSILMRKRLLVFAGALLPFGFLAIIYQRNGGIGLNIADVFFILIAGTYFVLAIANGSYRRLPRYFLIPILFALYGIVWALLPVQIFAGEIYVFSLSGEVGHTVSNAFRSTIVPVAPSMANISQLFYFLWFLIAFLFFRSVNERDGSQPLVQLLTAAAVMNIFLCFLNVIHADQLLSLFQTADYKSLTGAKINSISRVTGGFPEASRLADFVVPLGAFFSSLYMFNGQRGHFFLGAISLILGLMTLSSTAFIGIAAFAAVIMVSIFRQGNLASWQRISLVCSIGLVVMLSVLLIGNYFNLVSSLLNELIFSKLDSQSGLERGAWARQGFIAFWESYGLGVGIGSARSNGLLPVLLSNAGLIGLLFFVALIFPVFTRSAGSSVQRAGFVAFMVILTMKLVSQTTMTFGIPFALYIALAIGPNGSTSKNSYPELK